MSVGDRVVVTSGKYDGKLGEIATVTDKSCKLIIDGQLTAGYIALTSVKPVSSEQRTSSPLDDLSLLGVNLPALQTGKQKGLPKRSPRAAAAAAADSRGSDEEEDDAISGAPVGTPAAGRATPLAPQTPQTGGGRPDIAAEEVPVPVEVLKKKVQGRGHQYLCRMEGGGEKPLPGKVIEERYPELLAAFNKKEDAVAAAAAAASTSEEQGEASELAPAPAVGAAGPSGYPYTFLGAEFDVAKREVALVHGGKGEHMLDAMQARQLVCHPTLVLPRALTYTLWDRRLS